MVLASVKTLQKGCVLIIDDDPDVRETLRILLDNEGYECQDAANFQQALHMLKEEPFDLVITDLHLADSGATGLDIIDQVVLFDQTIPVILITAFPSISSAVDAVKRGAMEFLSKPFDREQLVHLVSKALKERQLRMENQRLQAEVNKAAVIERLNRELNNRISELTRLYTISEGLNQFLDSDALFDRITYLAAEVTGAQRVSLMLLDRQRRHLKIRSAIGLGQELISSVCVPIGVGIAGRVAQTGLPVRMTHNVSQEEVDADGSHRPIYRTNSWLSVPLIIGQEIFGVINLTDKLDMTDFTRQDEQLLQSLSEKGGIKIENQALYEGIYANLVDTLTSLVTTIEAKDPYTRQHSQRVTEYAICLGRKMGMDEEQIEMLNFAAMLHDIGKIGIRDDILTKCGRLTDEEYQTIKQHPITGERIVAPLGLIKAETEIIRHHHERYDGKGYPDGLKGEEIPLPARIVAVTDAFDAMTTTRSYRKALSVEVALGEMERCAGTQFDPQIARCMIEAIRDGLIKVPEVEEILFDIAAVDNSVTPPVSLGVTLFNPPG